ncbi:MAG: hypothetical protein LUE63_02725 [Lachnospiraceae bacterium]|nr:hypothetical protein [Lachnospiraceae bacterium]
MLILYVAVLLVMAALNVFLVFIIRQMVVITNRQVQMHFSREMGRCTGALDEKLAELSETEERLREVTQRVKEQEAAARRAGSQIGSASSVKREGSSSSLFYQSGVSYSDREALDLYRTIRDGMDLDYEGLIRAVAQQSRAPERDWELSGQILEKLDFDFQYRLVTASPALREELLHASLNGEELSALERIAPIRDYPDPIKRMDRVRQYRMLYDPRVRVICGEKSREGSPGPDETTGEEIYLEYDPAIHEGIRVRMGDGVLDYSI